MSEEGKVRLEAYEPVPNVTTSERDSVSDVTQGTIIFNTTTNKFQGYNGTDWVDLH
tara:strand:+ start:221 stop:388 length:168 start_codon:yes stop_codon:yes gene_type:complete